MPPEFYDISVGWNYLAIPPPMLFELGAKKRGASPIILREKFFLTTIATNHEMVKSAGIMNTWFACHEKSIKKKYQIVKPDPPFMYFTAQGYEHGASLVSDW